MPGDNKFTTENFMRLNFSPKPGVTPGTNDTLWMNCDQVTARYLVSISGATPTGKRWPMQNQILPPTVPTVITLAVTNIMSTTATGNGNITSDGGSDVTTRGIEWSLYDDFSVIAGTSYYSVAGTGLYTGNLSGLTPSATYHVRAFAINSVGTGYGNAVSFLAYDSMTLPSVSTDSVTSPTATTATSGGNVTSDGGATVTDRGIQWSLYSNFSVIAGSASSGSGLGSFTANITGLTANTTYYVRAYATNSAGTGYGNTIPFTTTASCPVPLAAGITFPGYPSNPQVIQTGASAYGCPVLERLIVYGTAPNPTKTGNKVVLTNIDGQINTNFTVSGTWYFGSYVRTAGGEDYEYFNSLLTIP